MPEYTRVCDLSDIPDSGGRRVVVDGRPIGLFRLDGAVHAIDDTCPHADASLCEGDVSGGEVACPLHFATFDLRTGACTGPPADEDLRTYPVRVTDDGGVEVATEPG
jgi:nitrite reductase/ring-hydroxylating ferredoxin subunit